MGSSLGLALKKRGVAGRVIACARRAEVRARALEIGAADEACENPVEAVAGAELVVFCVPILTIPELAKAAVPALKPGAVLTDVGSTKVSLTGLMAEALKGTGAVFVGSHPICGSEQQGIEAANADLYEGSVTVVTRVADTPDDAIAVVFDLWNAVGSMVREMTAAGHDAALASTSHLPHLAAAALVNAVDANGALCGSGFRDTTRVAEGSPVVWRDILSTNREALKTALTGYQLKLDELLALLDENDPVQLEAWLAAARDKRKELLG